MIANGDAHRNSVLLVHPTGSAFVRHALRALVEAEMLAGFLTTIAWQPDNKLARFLPVALRSQLARRGFQEIPDEFIQCRPWREAIRLLARRAGWNTLVRHERGPFSDDAVYRALDYDAARLIARGSAPTALYTYEDCALESFASAARRDIRRVYELPIAHYRKAHQILNEERELKPAWAATLIGLHDSAEKLERKDRELATAEAIIVPSRFVATSLQSYPGGLSSPVYVVPYGAPPAGPPRPARRSKQPLRILFVGSLGQRKGIGYLLDATELLDRAKIPYTLTLLGGVVAHIPELDRAIVRHRWIATAPNAEVLQLMRQHDVFVFPTLVEGRALVVLEAMSQGLPVITTTNSGNDDVVIDGTTGFIVPIRSAEAIARRLTQLAEDPDLVQAMSEAARQKAIEHSWDYYRSRFIETLQNFFAGQQPFTTGSDAGSATPT